MGWYAEGPIEHAGRRRRRAEARDRARQGRPAGAARHDHAEAMSDTRRRHRRGAHGPADHRPPGAQGLSTCRDRRRPEEEVGGGSEERRTGSADAAATGTRQRRGPRLRRLRPRGARAARDRTADALQGSIVAILSTIHPKTVKELAEASKGFHVVDSTVCRGGDAADKGTLLSFVGGAEDVVERITPVLKAYSADVVHTGGVGIGAGREGGEQPDHVGVPGRRPRGARARAALWRRRRDAAPGARHVAARRTRRSRSGARRPWPGPRTTWRSWPRWPPTAGSRCRRRASTREICRALKPRRYKLDEYGK